MSQLNVDNIQNRTGSNGGPNFPSGITVAVGQTAYIHGNLQVDGTETIVNTETLNVADKTVGIGSTSNASNTTADGAGIEVFASSSQTGNNKTITWQNSSNAWTFGGGGIVATDSVVGSAVTINSSGIDVTGVVTATSFKGDGSQLSGIDATAIQTGNTSVQTVDTGSDGHVKMTTEGGERVRVGPAGQIGLGGANYGTSGQVITSAGSGSAPTWSAIPPGGNVVDMVADGAIGAGKPCIITSGGKAQQVGLVPQASSACQDDRSSAELTNPNSSVDNSLDLIYNPDRGRLLMSSRGGNGSQENGRVAVFEYSPDLGTDTVSNKGYLNYVGSSTSEDTCITYDPDTSQAIVGYRLNSDVYVSCMQLAAGTDAITFGNRTEVYTGHSPTSVRVVYDTHNDKVIIIWHHASANTLWARAGTVNATTTGDVGGFGTAVQLPGAAYDGAFQEDRLDACWDSTNNKVIVIFRNTNASNHLYAVTLTASGTTLTWGTPQNVMNIATDYPVIAFDEDKGKALMTFQNDGNNRGVRRALWWDPSGNQFSVGAESEWPGSYGKASLDLKGHDTCWDPASKAFYTAGTFTDDSDKPFITQHWIDTSNNSITQNSTHTRQFDGSGNQSQDHPHAWAIAALGSTGKVVCVMRNMSNSYYPNMFLFETMESLTNINSVGNNFLGFAPSAISDGVTGTINLPGNTVDTSGLTAGTRHYVQNDGTMSTNFSHSRAGLLALSATKGVIYGHDT